MLVYDHKKRPDFITLNEMVSKSYRSISPDGKYEDSSPS
jgi:hypothetical protein